MTFIDLTPNGTETEELLADAYAAKRIEGGGENDVDDHDMTRVEEDQNDSDEMDGMAEQTLTDGEGSDSGSLEVATLTPTKSVQRPDEKDILVRWKKKSP